MPKRRFYVWVSLPRLVGFLSALLHHLTRHVRVLHVLNKPGLGSSAVRFGEEESARLRAHVHLTLADIAGVVGDYVSKEAEKFGTVTHETLSGLVIAPVRAAVLEDHVVLRAEHHAARSVLEVVLLHHLHPLIDGPLAGFRVHAVRVELHFRVSAQFLHASHVLLEETLRQVVGLHSSRGFRSVGEFTVVAPALHAINVTIAESQHFPSGESEPIAGGTELALRLDLDEHSATGFINLTDLISVLAELDR